MVEARVVKLKENPTIGKNDLEIIEETLRSTLQEGEFLVKADLIAIDSDAILNFDGPNRAPKGTQIATVIQSRSAKFKIGDQIQGPLEWRTHSILNENNDQITVTLNPSTLSLSILGLPGQLAYYGLQKIASSPKTNEVKTLVISSAAGAVGSHAGQIARILLGPKCRIVGITGSDRNGEKLITQLGFDDFINHNAETIEDLKKIVEAKTPQGIDAYFDNVGGEITSLVLTKMNKFGRVVICGPTLGCNVPVSEIQTAVKTRHLKLEGISILNQEVQKEAVQQNLKWHEDGSLEAVETVIEGFDNIVGAYLSVLREENWGSSIIKV